MKDKSLSRIVLIAIFAALAFVLGQFTKIPIPGGYFTLLDAGIFVTAMTLGKTSGAAVGAVAALFLDLLGFPAYAPFSFVIHGAQGFLGNLTRNKIVNYALSAVVMVGGYFVADMVVVHSLGTAIPDLFFNGVQTTAGYVIALIVAPLLKRTGVFDGFGTTEK
ncbi:MAG: ECF transporter S component [Streptococcaceae bacterium]|jgi:uncharacterized membrane protein|nr:ECF transporter S component [Streptococcaceae bacterium]